MEVGELDAVAGREGIWSPAWGVSIVCLGGLGVGWPGESPFSFVSETMLARDIGSLGLRGDCTIELCLRSRKAARYMYIHTCSGVRSKTSAGAVVEAVANSGRVLDSSGELESLIALAVASKV